MHLPARDSPELVRSVLAVLRKILAHGGSHLPSLPDGEETTLKLAIFGGELLFWNRRLRLTGLKTPDEIVEKGIYPSLRAATYVDRGARVVDVGSGNGLPGLVLAVATAEASVILIERSRSRVAFLKTAAHKMDAKNVTVLAGKVQDNLTRVTGDVVISMATFKPLEWLRIAGPLTVEEGKVLVLHAGIRRARLPCEAYGMRLVETDEFTLPWSGHPRGISIYKKIH